MFTLLVIIPPAFANDAALRHQYKIAGSVYTRDQNLFLKAVAAGLKVKDNNATADALASAYASRMDSDMIVQRDLIVSIAPSTANGRAGKSLAVSAITEFAAASNGSNAGVIFAKLWHQAGLKFGIYAK